MESDGQRSRASTFLLTFALVTVALVPGAASEEDLALTRVAVGLTDFPLGLAQGDLYDGEPVVLAVPEIGMLVVLTADAPGFIARQGADPNVRYVHEDVLQDLLAEREPVPPPVSPLLTPNDPQYGSMYGPQQVRANLAWDTVLGDMDAAVCVVDTGVRRTHQDLGTARYLGGYDYVNDDTDASDDQGHGTHVAGTAVGAINNGIGVAGMGNTGYYSVKVLDSGGFGSWADVAAGITWCANNGIPRTVISLSLGGSGSDPGVSDAIHYAYATKGMLVVAASGNGYCDNCVLFPGRHAEAVGVACTTSSESSCAFTSKGPEVDVAGPGDGILSTCYGSDTQYCTKSGTSMSTPHVSGVLALVWSHETALTASQLWQRLNDTSEDLGAAGKDSAFGWGRVDALCLITNTICSVPPPPPPPLADVFLETFESGTTGWTFTGLWHASTCRSLSPSTSIAYKKVGACSSNFDTGGTNSGEATSPSILIPGGATVAKLRLGSWYSTEGGTTYDKKLVQVSTNNGTFVQVFQESGTSSTWNALEIDVSSKIGSAIRVKLRFDSVDSIANGGEGWYVDNVRIAADVNLGPPTVPFPPGAVAVTAGPGVGELRVTWSAPWNGGSPITQYNVYGADGAAGPFTLVGTSTTTSFTQSGLGDGVTRHYKVSATNAIGEGNQSASASGVTFVLPGAPPSTSATAGAGAGQITIAWNAAPNGGTPILSYKVYRATNATGPFAYLATAPSTSYVDSGLPEGTRYWYEVSAVNLVGEGNPGPIANARTFTRPTAPQNLNARPGGALLSIDLTWQAPADNGGTPVTSYLVFRDGVYAGNTTNLTYRDRSLNPIDVYFYKVAAVNLVGQGALSNEDCSRPSPWPSAMQSTCEIFAADLATGLPEIEPRRTTT